MSQNEPSEKTEKLRNERIKNDPRTPVYDNVDDDRSGRVEPIFEKPAPPAMPPLNEKEKRGE